MATDSSQITQSVEPITENDLHRVMYSMKIAALLSALPQIRGKAIKTTLTRIEADGMLSQATRKHILDGYGEAFRDLQELLLSVAE
jgi:hypothetical protein